MLHAYMPASTETLLAALGESDLSWSATAFAEHGALGSVAPLEPLFPKR
jgi:hypothetical protein